MTYRELLLEILHEVPEDMMDFPVCMGDSEDELAFDVNLEIAILPPTEEDLENHEDHPGYVTLNLSEFNLPCADCETNTYYEDNFYMVSNEVWNKAIKTKEEAESLILCMGCLSKRLGRPLTGEDFPREIPINENNDTVNALWSLQDNVDMN